MLNSIEISETEKANTDAIQKDIKIDISLFGQGWTWEEFLRNPMQPIYLDLISEL